MRDIPEFEGRYAATSCGKIWSHKRHKFLKPCGEKGNYQIVWLIDKTGKGRSYYIHRLVALAFLPNPDNLPEVNHIDRHKDNNLLSNLEWCTKQYNLAHRGGMSRKTKPVYCIELDKTFNSVYEAAKAMNKSQPNLCTHLNKGNPKTFAGYHWEYTN